MNSRTNEDEAKTADLLGRIQGLTVALCTPLDEQYNLDVEGLERLIERVIEGGGFMPLSSGLVWRAAVVDSGRS